MVFSSFAFISIFMPIFFVCYYLLPGRMKNAVLFLGSFVFYFAGTINHPLHFVLFVGIILMDYCLGIGMEKKAKYKKAFLLTGVSLHLVSLCFFKYSGFLSGEIPWLFIHFPAFSELVLPLGISFYTFQGIAYLADIYREKTPAEKSLLDFSVHSAMFAHVTSGPIVSYGKIREELKERDTGFQMGIRGFSTFVFGLGLKVLLANPLGKLWSQTVAIGFESVSTPLAWMGVAAFSLQIYFDFFGYSLMAEGLGRMMGFSLPQNFDHPYTSLTMTEFWRRWHITLGRWFRDYVYIPMGGNRKGTVKTVRNLLVVWILTGIWHGAGYNFILWGLFLFLIIASEKWLTGKYLERHPLVGHIYMVVLIPLSWAVFAVGDLSRLGVLFTRLFPFFGQGVWSVFKYDYWKYIKMYYPFFIFGILFSTKLPYIWLKRLKKKKILMCVLLLLILAASLYCIYVGLDDPFLYFRF